MIVETVKVGKATVVVHDDSYIHRTKEEIESLIGEYCRIVTDSAQKKKTA